MPSVFPNLATLDDNMPVKHAHDFPTQWEIFHGHSERMGAGKMCLTSSSSPAVIRLATN
jgi:hypothetical protein